MKPIIVKFYNEELSGVYKRDDVYKVERIVKRKKVWENIIHGYLKPTYKT